MSKQKNVTKLDKKSITALADELESRRLGSTDRRDSDASRSDSSNSNNEGYGTKGVFFWGAASGLALAIAAPLLNRQARPVMRGAIKGGILASRYVQRAASGIKEDVQDLTAEAKADLDVEKNPSEPV